MTTGAQQPRVWRAALVGAALAGSLVLALLSFHACGSSRHDGQPASTQEGGGSGWTANGTPGPDSTAVDADDGNSTLDAAGGGGRDPGSMVDAGWELTDLLRVPDLVDAAAPAEPDGGWESVDAGACLTEKFDPAGADCIEGSVCVVQRTCGPHCVCVSGRYECDYPECAFQCPAEPPAWDTYFCHPELQGGCVYRRGCIERECICSEYQFGVDWGCSETNTCDASAQ